MASAETLSSYRDALDSQYLSNSFSSLSQSRSTNSLIVRTYKQATQLYLTKRFHDALDALEPIITARGRSDGISNGIGENNGIEGGNDENGPAPVAQSSRGTRTKVWVFYLTLLHGIVDLGPEEGREKFGAARWKTLATKVREGSIWEEIVQRGYGGVEADVDADVVVNLATLLLGHMPHQKLNQQRLETYLAAWDGGNGQLAWGQDGISTPMSNSSSSPKMLATRLKVLELYTLHVLPANDEWEYAQSFIDVNDMLDEERREAFLNALQMLKEEKDGTAKRERELKEQREREIEQQKREEEEEARRAEEAEARAEEARRRAAAEAAQQQQQQRTSTSRTSMNGNTSSTIPKPSATAATGAASTARPARPVKKAPPSPPPASIYRRASAVLSNLQNTLLGMGRNINFTSMALLRLVMFMLAFLVLIARQDVRARIRRGLDDGWKKLKQTVGMGVKVSYI